MYGHRNEGIMSGKGTPRGRVGSQAPRGESKRREEREEGKWRGMKGGYRGRHEVEGGREVRE